MAELKYMEELPPGYSNILTFNYIWTLEQEASQVSGVQHISTQRNRLKGESRTQKRGLKESCPEFKVDDGAITRGNVLTESAGRKEVKCSIFPKKSYLRHA